MEITLEKKDPTTGRLKINLKEADYQPKVSEKLKEYSKKAQIKGFRPGKVPAGLINKMYGKGILVDEINNLLSESINKYIKDNKLSIVGDPLPDSDQSNAIDWDNQKDFEFFYNIGLVPEFKYELSDKVKITKYKIEVEEKVVGETVQNLQNQYGKMENPEVVAEGDFVYGDLKEKEGDFTTKTLIPLNKVKKSELKTFVGKKKEELVEFNIEKTFEDESDIAYVTGLNKEEAAKKKGKFELTITNISRTQPAALDQEFFDKIFGPGKINSEEEFNKKLRETVEENYQRETENLLTRDIFDQFVENTKIELPKDFLKEWLLITNKGNITKEQIDNEFDQFAKDLKWNLIKNKIAEDNQIKVENAEIIEKTKQMISEQFGGMTITDELAESFNKIADNYLKQDNGKNYMKMFEQVFLDKVLAAIKDKINIQEKTVNVEEFKKLVSKK